MGTITMASKRQKEKANSASAKIAKAILEEYQPENTSDMTSALKDIFGSMFEAMLQGECDRNRRQSAFYVCKRNESERYRFNN